MNDIKRWQLNFETYINELNLPRDDYRAVMEYIEEVPIQPEPMCVAKVTLTDEQVKEAFEKAKCEILAVQSVREERWIPFKTRSLTEEEKEEHPEWECILDCILPDDGQAILVSINLKGHERVQYDEFYTDDGSYLDSGYEIGSEATAWMPLPEPYREEEQND